MNRIAFLTVVMLVVSEQTAARPQFNGQGGQYRPGQFPPGQVRPIQFRQGQRPSQFGGQGGPRSGPFGRQGPGSLTGFGIGNAGPGGVSASGGGIAASSNGVMSFASGQGFGLGNPFGQFTVGSAAQLAQGVAGK